MSLVFGANCNACLFCNYSENPSAGVGRPNAEFSEGPNRVEPYGYSISLHRTRTRPRTGGQGLGQGRRSENKAKMKTNASIDQSHYLVCDEEYFV